MSFSFGAPAAQQPTGNFSFGAAKTAATSVGGFGQAQAATGFGAAPAAVGFGAAPAAVGFGAAPAAGGAFGTTQAVGFGAATTQSVGFGAPIATQPAPATSFSFGAPTTGITATPAFGGLGGGVAAPATSAAPAMSGVGAFSFSKAPAVTSAAASLNFGTTTTSAGGIGSSLFGKPAGGINTTAPATAPTPFVGLGGIDVSATQPKAGDSKQDNVKVKETQVPDEIAKTVDSIKSYIKAQKTLSSDIGRTSTSKLSNVSGEIMNLQWSLQEISNSVEANYNHIKLMRKETSKTIQSVEMAQRTQDTPAGLQYENNAPFQYFQNLVAKYEQDLINFRHQIALTERHMRSLTNPQNISPEDLKRGFQQINESFISLAGRLHEIHQKVEAQKEQFLNLRKYRLRDSTNVFAKLDKPETKVDTSRITSGPTPFSNISAMSSFGKSFNSTAAGNTTVQSSK